MNQNVEELKVAIADALGYHDQPIDEMATLKKLGADSLDIAMIGLEIYNNFRPDLRSTPMLITNKTTVKDIIDMVLNEPIKHEQS